jgi:hypothetical protein
MKRRHCNLRPMHSPLNTHLALAVAEDIAATATRRPPRRVRTRTRIPRRADRKRRPGDR